MARTALLTLAVLLLAAAPAGARPAKNLKVGIGEQNPAFFQDEQWQALDIPFVRLAVAWDALKSEWETAEIDAWMAAARASDAKPLVTFSHGRDRGENFLPRRRGFMRQFRKFRRRYPDVTRFQVWNEANHGTQPTHRRPGRVARYFDAMKRYCEKCVIAAPSVLDMDRMVRWIRRFRRHARHRVRIWSIHNHIDANRHRRSGTRKLLRHTRGRVWFTETGGISRRWIGDRRIEEYTRRNAGRATRNVFRLARMSPRIKRIYFYHWTAPDERRPRWDSAFFGRSGKARPAYRVLRRQVRRVR